MNTANTTKRPKQYIVATIKHWNIDSFERQFGDQAENWHLVSHPDELNVDRLLEIDPRYIFFPHWSWLVPEPILGKFECVCFHMTDVPYGRGGSPLQNLIFRGHKETMLSALRMVRELDAGPVYMKKPLELSGTAQEIYERATAIAFAMMDEIANVEPVPQEQEGEIVMFQRRTPEESKLPLAGPLEKLYDHIRMLDADSYPQAFIDYGEYRLNFDNAELRDDDLVTRVSIRRKR